MARAYFRDAFLTTTDGLTIYCRDYPGPSPEAPVALCLHGLSRNSRDFEDVAPILQRSHRVLVPDQRGRGRSDHDDRTERYLPQTYVMDMLQLLDAQRVDRCAIVGTSMGGLMAMGLNALTPGRISHVVINDIGPVIAAEGLARIKSVVGSKMAFTDWSEAADYVRAANGAAFPDYGPSDWYRFAARACSQRDGQVVLDYDPEITAPMKTGSAGAAPDDLWPLFDGLAETPVLLLRGEISDLLSLDCVAEMQRRHPRMDLLEVPGVGHAPMLDESGVMEAIIAFLAS